MSDKWVYTVEKIGLMWHYSLKTSADSMNHYSAACWTKWGAMRAMRGIKRREEKRQRTKETGNL